MQQQAFESGEGKQADDGCLSNRASKDQEMRSPTVECEVRSQTSKMPQGSVNEEQIGNITSSGKEKKSFTYENDSTSEGQQPRIYREGKDIEVKNRSSMIRTRREGTCNATISPGQERFLPQGHKSKRKTYKKKH